MAIVLALAFFAARQGLLGKQVKKITVEMVKETPPPKPKEPEKPVNLPKPLPAVAEAPKSAPPKAEAPKEAAQAPPPAVSASPVAIAPAAAELPSFQFDGGKTVQTSSDPVLLYKAMVEAALARTGAARRESATTALSPRWKSGLTAPGASAIRCGKRAPATLAGTIPCGKPSARPRPWIARPRRPFLPVFWFASMCKT